MWWLRPTVGLLGLISLLVALGGPGVVVSASFTASRALATAASAMVGAALVLGMLWHPRKYIRPGRAHLIGVGAATLIGLWIRDLLGSAPILAAIVLGLLGGFCCAASILPSALRK